MLLSLFLTCFVALLLGLGLLFALGHRVRFASRLAALLLAVAVTAAAGEVAARVWSLPARYVIRGQILLLVLAVLVVLARRVWNPVGQVFFATFLASVLTYLFFAIETTAGDGLSPGARIASSLLLLFEIAALVMSTSFTFESCDTICRVRPSRLIRPPDPDHRPMVSLQLAAYNEPPDMLIDTIRSLEGLDYPNFEIVVIDNNTKDEEVWGPVEEYCRDRPRVRFVHVDPWPGFKAGALNLVLERYTHPDAEVIGIVDADYAIEPDWLTAVVGYFADPKVAYVQTPQDYREYENDSYLRACYDAYAYFFASTMPSRNERNSIIFAGTMGLLRRSALVEVGGWNEWCITEDAELSLRLLAAGYDGVYVPESYGHGVMPLTFSALKSQRFRWCFGGMQIIRLHWQTLRPWGRHRDQLTAAQRADYLVGNLQWLNDLVYLGFTVALLASGVALVDEGTIGIRPLYGAAVLLPAALITSGVVRALWALRRRTGIGVQRAFLAFVNWLALSWTVALACMQGLTRAKGVFLRTPKEGDRRGMLTALWATRAESLLAAGLWALGATVVVVGQASAFVAGLFAWQGAVYASAPFMSWLNQHTELSAQLERRRRTERRRERVGELAPYLGAAGALSVAGVVAAIIVVGGANPGDPGDPFATPAREANDDGPISHLVSGTPDAPVTTTTSTMPSEESTSSTGSSTTTTAGTTPTGDSTSSSTSSTTDGGSSTSSTTTP